MVNQSETERYLENWQDEIESAYLYRALAAAKSQPALAEVYRRLADTQESHAQFWQNKLLQLDHPLPRRRICWRTRILTRLAKWLGPQFVLPTINAMEQVDSHSYDMQADTHDTLLPVQERSHARLLHTITITTKSGMEGSALAQLEGRHRTAGGNTLRAAVPVMPFIVLEGLEAIGLSLLLSGLALFLIGAGITLLTGRSVFYSGMRQVIFGFAAAGITFGIGRLLGVSLAG